VRFEWRGTRANEWQRGVRSGIVLQQLTCESHYLRHWPSLRRVHTALSSAVWNNRSRPQTSWSQPGPTVVNGQRYRRDRSAQRSTSCNAVASRQETARTTTADPPSVRVAVVVVAAVVVAAVAAEWTEKAMTSLNISNSFEQ